MWESTAVGACGKVFLPLVALSACPATARDLEAPRGHEWVVLLHTTKPRIFVSPGKEEEGEVEARNLRGNNKRVNQLFYVKIINNKLLLEQRYSFL